MRYDGLTGAADVRCWTSIGVSSFTSTCDGIRCLIVWTDRIRVAFTISNIATIWKSVRNSDRVVETNFCYLCRSLWRRRPHWRIRPCICKQLHCLKDHESRGRDCHSHHCSLCMCLHRKASENHTLNWLSWTTLLPVQMTPVPSPVLLYPILHVHTTPLFDDSCEQSAFTSQRPLFTWQLSVSQQYQRRTLKITVNVCLRGVLPVQVTFVAEPVLTYPVLHVQTTALVLFSCEQIEFPSHPPFFTWQLSVTDTQQKYVH